MFKTKKHLIILLVVSLLGMVFISNIPISAAPIIGPTPPPEYAIRGYIYEEHNDEMIPIEGADVYLDGVKIDTSGSSGYYFYEETVENPNERTLVVQHDYFIETESFTFVMNRDIEKDIVLEERKSFITTYEFERSVEHKISEEMNQGGDLLTLQHVYWDVTFDYVLTYDYSTSLWEPELDIRVEGGRNLDEYGNELLFESIWFQGDLKVFGDNNPEWRFFDINPLENSQIGGPLDSGNILSLQQMQDNIIGFESLLGSPAGEFSFEVSAYPTRSDLGTTDPISDPLNLGANTLEVASSFIIKDLGQEFKDLAVGLVDWDHNNPLSSNQYRLYDLEDYKNDQENINGPKINPDILENESFFNQFKYLNNFEGYMDYNKEYYVIANYIENKYLI